MIKILLTATVQSHICQFHRPLVDMLREHGNVEIHVAAKDNLAEKNGLKLDFVDKVYNVPFSRSPKSFENIKAYKKLKKIIMDGQYDFIHCNTPMGGIVTRLAATKTRKAGTKIFYTAHGFHFYKEAPKKYWIIYYPIEKLFSRKTDKLITINEEDYALAKKRFCCQIEHIHGVGVDPERYYPISEEEKRALKEKLGFDTNKKLILCVGELLPNKNQKMAIGAMRSIAEEFPNATLLIAGNGPQKDNLISLIESYGLQDNVKLLGYITSLEDYQRISDVAISCSIREGLGLNLIEAMLTGNPVVATKNRGHNELIKDESNGFLVEKDDEYTLSCKIKELLKDDKLRRDMGLEAIKGGSKYIFTVVKKELEKIYFQ